MRKRVYGRRLSRTTNERKALFRSLAVALFTHGRIDTTEAKAKAVRPWVEKLVTRSKSDDLSSRRLLLSDLPNQKIVNSLLTSIGPTFSSRPGGYTRLTRLGHRFGDNAPMVRLEFVEEVKGLAQEAPVKSTEKEKKPEVKAPAKETPQADTKVQPPRRKPRRPLSAKPKKPLAQIRRK